MVERLQRRRSHQGPFIIAASLRIWGRVKGGRRGRRRGTGTAQQIGDNKDSKFRQELCSRHGEGEAVHFRNGIERSGFVFRRTDRKRASLAARRGPPCVAVSGR